MRPQVDLHRVLEEISRRLKGALDVFKGLPQTQHLLEDMQAVSAQVVSVICLEMGCPTDWFISEIEVREQEVLYSVRFREAYPTDITEPPERLPWDGWPLGPPETL